MELQGRLKHALAEIEEALLAEEAEASHPCEVEDLKAQLLRRRTRYSYYALHAIVELLHQYCPEITQVMLAREVHSILHTEVVVGDLGQLKATLREIVPRDRGQWLSEDVEEHLAAKQFILAAFRAKAKRAAAAFQQQAYRLTQEPSVQILVVSAGSGAVALGGTWGAIGLAGGVTGGAAIGLLPAPLTLGLSIPFGAALGGSSCALVAAAAGGAVGLLGGSVAGGAVIAYQSELRSGAVAVRDRAASLASSGQETWSMATGTLQQRVLWVVKDVQLQTAAVAATGGALLAGTSGGVAGFLAGSAAGAACGVVPALFTFGLSIPIGAAVGGAAGMCAGVVTGSAAGLVGGGVTGYGAYAKRQEICSGASDAWAKVSGLAESVKERANISASFVKTRLGGETGGTA